MWIRLPGLTVVGLLAACTATVDGGEIVEVDGDDSSPRGDPADPGGDDPGDDPSPPRDPPGEDPGEDLPPPPPGPAGTCWGELHFDQACSRERAGASWESARFPGAASMTAMVSTDAVANAALVSFGPAGAASSARWSDALVSILPGQADHAHLGALRLVIPAAGGGAMDVVHANAASTRADFRGHWQDAPLAVQAPGFTAAYYEVDGQSLTWQSAASAGGVVVSHTVELAGVAHVHEVEVGAGGATTYRYVRREGGQDRESWSSDDGRSWTRQDAAGDDRLEGEAEQLGWSIPLPAAFAAEGIGLEARHAAWGPELGWLEGRFGGLSAPLVDGFGLITDLWVDVQTASIRSFSVLFWDGTALHEWDASGGRLEENSEFAATYQTDHGSAVEVTSEGTVVAAVEAIAEASQVRVVARDTAAPPAIETSWRWEIVYDTHDALPTGEVAIERTDGSGCARQLSYDFGASWAVEACR